MLLHVSASGSATMAATGSGMSEGSSGTNGTAAPDKTAAAASERLVVAPGALPGTAGKQPLLPHDGDEAPAAAAATAATAAVTTAPGHHHTHGGGLRTLFGLFPSCA